MALQSGIIAGLVSSFRLHNLVLPALAAVTVAAVPTTGFVSIAPNRLLSGRPIGLVAATDMRFSLAIGFCAVILLLASIAPPARALRRRRVDRGVSARVPPCHSGPLRARSSRHARRAALAPCPPPGGRAE